MNAIDRAQRAYSAQVSPVQTDRSVEYAAFVHATRRLTAATAPDAPFARLAEALHENQRLWTTLAIATSDDDNALPRELRARLFYLAEFTRQHTRKVLRREASAEVLVEINRAIMQGLRGEGGE